MSEKIVDVAAGLILRPDGMLLLGQRPEGKPWSGWWEPVSYTHLTLPTILLV